MAYDYEAAKKAGATDDQIIQYLTQTRKYDVDSAIKSGANKQQIIQYLTSTAPQSSPQVEAKPVDTRDTLQKTGDVVNSIFPGKQIGTAIGNSIYGVGQLIRGNKAGFDQAAQDNSKMVKKVAGDAASVVATGLGVAAPAASTVVGKAAQFGALAATQGVGASLAEGNKAKQVAIDAFQSGLTGLVIGAATGVAEKGINKLLNKTPENIYNNALRVTSRIKDAGKSPSQFLLDKGTWGSLGSINKAADDGISEANAVINQRLANTPQFVESSSILQKAIENLKGSKGALYSDAQIEDIVKKLPISDLLNHETLTLEEANRLRQQIDRTLGDRFFLTSAEPAINKEALGAVNNALRNTVKDLSGTHAEFTQLSKWIQTKKVVDRAINIADSKYGLGLFDIISGSAGVLGGIASGETTGDKLKNAAVFGGVGLGLERAARSPKVLTGLAQALDKIGKLPTDSLGRISKATVTKLIGELTASN